MKTILKAAFFAVSLSLIFTTLNAETAVKPAENSKKQEAVTAPSTEKLKDILYKLVKQDEYLDETIETIEEKNAKLDSDEISAAVSSLKLIRKNMEHISYLNKNELSNMEPDTEIFKYTKTIMLYSTKINKKTSQLAAFVNSAIMKNKRAMRNAPSSKKGKKAGKKLGQIIQEQKNMELLRNELASLNKSAGKVKATSKWLYIASK